MQHAPNFSFDATVIASKSTTRLVGQFDAPDHEHLVLTTSKGTSSELLFIGSKTYVRNATGAWQDAFGRVTGSSNPRAAFGALAGSSCHSVALPSRSPGTRYECTLTAHNASAILQGATARGLVKGSVTVNGVGISDLSLHGKGFAMVIDYTNVGTTPPVQPPA
jgi:hypothetical protein